MLNKLPAVIIYLINAPGGERHAQSAIHRIPVHRRYQVRRSRSHRQGCLLEASYYNWKAKFGGMEASDIKKMKDLEDENHRLKQMFADLSLECLALKDVIEKSFKTSDKE